MYYAVDGGNKTKDVGGQCLSGHAAALVNPYTQCRNNEQSSRWKQQTEYRPTFRTTME